MDEQRLSSFWEYAVTGKQASPDQVFAACAMYADLPDEAAKASLRALVDKVFPNAGTPAEEALATLLKGDNELSQFLVDARKDVKPKDTLRTILQDDLSDDEDDEDVSGGEDEQEKVGLTILMRGFLKKKDTKCEWSGSWAMTTEAFDAGDKAKFRFDLRGQYPEMEKDGKIVAPPKNALLDGSFLVKDANAPNGFIRIDENGVKMEFIPVAGTALKWKIKGSGKNINGDFTLDGELDGTSRRMALFKTYKYIPRGDASSEGSSSDIDEEDDVIDPDELDDLKADQRETFGMVLGRDEDETATDAPKAKKKRRIVE